MNEGTMGEDRWTKGPIGFGCAYVTGGFEKNKNIKLLASIFDSGIKYFDTAPMYGHGTSEEVVGAAFRARRHQIAIATKVGIPHPAYNLSTQLLRAVATPVRRYFPKISRAGAAALYGSRQSPRELTPASLLRSVENSLTRLQTDYIDLLLLHDAQFDEVTPALVDGLEKMVAQGKILRVGAAASLKDLFAIDRGHPSAFEVYQRAWAVTQNDEDLFAHKTRIFHRGVMYALEELRARMNRDEEFASRLRRATGLALTESDEIAKALIGASVSVNPQGVTLFGTRRRQRAVDYAKGILDGSYVAYGRALLAAIREGI